MTCNNCGRNQSEADNFCTSCGTPLAKQPEKNESSVSAASPSLSSWKPGNELRAVGMAETAWIHEALAYFTFPVPDLANIDSKLLETLVNETIRAGQTETNLAKKLRDGFGLAMSDSETLAHALITYSQERLDFKGSNEASGDKIEWLSGGCCSLCDSNEKTERLPGDKFPSGHRHPPACDYCVCTLLPVIEGLEG